MATSQYQRSGPKDALDIPRALRTPEALLEEHGSSLHGLATQQQALEKRQDLLAQERVPVALFCVAIDQCVSPFLSVFGRLCLWE